MPSVIASSTIISVTGGGVMIDTPWIGPGAALSVGNTGTPSIVASDGRLYLAGEGGEVIVVRASPELEELARNDMGDTLMATPAISGGTLYLRTRSALYAIAEKAAADSTAAAGSASARR